MKNPAASSGVSEEHDENYPKGVTPERFNRVSSSGFACGEPRRTAAKSVWE
jgi:hypothetical protein